MISLVLPGNLFHANLFRSSLERMIADNCGIDIIGQSKVPVSVSYQGIDYEIMPGLRETLARYPSIEVLDAPFSHSLLPLMHKDQQTWEVSWGERRHPVMFFPEFASPISRHIHDSFLVLGNETTSYSIGFTETEARGRTHDSYRKTCASECDAVDFEGRTGIVMKEFDSLLEDPHSGFFAFQRDTDRLSLLLDRLEEVAKSDTLTVIPVDIEAPYVGSFHGADIWRQLFTGIRERGLERYFVHLRDTVSRMKRSAKPCGDLDRNTGIKWTKWPEQSRFLSDIASIRPTSEGKSMLISLAGGSDGLASMCIRKERVEQSFTARRADGQWDTIPFSYSADVLSIALAARNALRDDTRFLKKIRKDCDQASSLVQRVTMLAEKYAL